MRTAYANGMPSVGSGRPPPANGGGFSSRGAAVERLPGLMSRAADLLLVLAHADTVVKARSPLPWLQTPVSHNSNVQAP